MCTMRELKPTKKLREPHGIARPRKLAPWRETERYFKRYRDKEKVIPLRPRTDGKVNP